MFEQSFVGNVPKTNRGWTLVASMALQVGGIAVLSVVPLLHPELLPRAAFSSILLAPALPPGPPPGPPPKEIPHAVAPRPQAERDTTFHAPGPHLNPVANIVEEPMEASAPSTPTGPYVVGSPGPATPGHAFTPPAPPKPAAEVRPAPAAEPKGAPPARLIAGGKVQEGLLISRVVPVYPRLAIQNRLEGQVVFHAIISREGLIESLTVTSGHPAFVAAAREAVRQWRYRPTLLNGEPCEVETTITVSFTLKR
jgi:protein TonB